mmetsp:Transcript_76448/g.222027  ORF Transcript_76448/g.222027 Transcript_76448/m.222027 type:complete len:204 (+) Transcript_76448:449-1060(+)
MATAQSPPGTGFDISAFRKTQTGGWRCRRPRRICRCPRRRCRRPWRDRRMIGQQYTACQPRRVLAQLPAVRRLASPRTRGNLTANQRLSASAARRHRRSTAAPAPAARATAAASSKRPRPVGRRWERGRARPRPRCRCPHRIQIEPPSSSKRRRAPPTPRERRAAPRNGRSRRLRPQPMHKVQASARRAGSPLKRAGRRGRSP